MHAGEASNASGQRAYGGKFLAITVETTMPAVKRHSKCTPARQKTAAASGHTAANSSRHRQNDPIGGETELKCTPAWRRTTADSGHTVANSSTPPSKRSRRRRNRMKNARRRSEQRQRPAGIRWQIPPRHRRNDHAGGETTFKMHAGEARKGSGQRAYGDKFLAAIVKTIPPAVKRHSKCTPARR